MPKDNLQEMLPVVDPHGVQIGSATRGQCHDGSMLLHPVAVAFLFDAKGRLLLQRRSATKLTEPGKWDASVGGHVGLGETPEEAILREVREEVGLALTPGTLRLLGSNILEVIHRCEPSGPHEGEPAPWAERELIYVYIGELRAEGIVCDPTEVSATQFFTRTEVQQFLKDSKASARIVNPGEFAKSSSELAAIFAIGETESEVKRRTPRGRPPTETISVTPLLKAELEALVFPVWREAVNTSGRKEGIAEA